MILNARWQFARAGSELLRRGALILALLVAADGCGDAPVSPQEHQQALQAQKTWLRKGGTSYVVEARIECFCPPYLAHWTRLQIEEGQVVSAEPLDQLPGGESPSVTGWLTVNDEFSRILQPADFLDNIDVRFDPALGYPTYIRATCGPEVTDCGSVHEMRNLKIVQRLE